jgi:hypothetical protein
MRASQALDVGSIPIARSIESAMEHFVQYHNPEKMGGKFQSSKKCFAIVTNKRGVEVGDVVWLVTGEGRPRRYFLCESFSVSEISSKRSGDFKYQVSGIDGTPFDPFIEIGNKAWFKELQSVTGNFRYGLQKIKNPKIVEAMQRASHS